MTIAGRADLAALSETARAKTTGTAAALAATLGLAVVGWVVVIPRMTGMDMGVATELGPFPSFIGLWVAMTAAMMLPGAVPAIVRCARDDGRARAVPMFVASYLAVWALAGIVVYALYRPHESFVAGAVTIAVGVYELTPLKGHFRRRCRDCIRSGFAFAVCCVGSCFGLMLMMMALSAMSIVWMCVITVVVLAQKLLRPHASVDRSLAFAIVGFGMLILAAPSSIPAIMPPM